MVERVARAMQERAKQPLYNIPSLEPVLVGSLGCAWEALAEAAIAAMREPTDEMTGACENGGAYWGKCPTCGGAENTWRVMIDAALK